MAHLNNLGYINSKEHDSVDFGDWNGQDIEIKREEMRRYMSIDYLYGCNYCNGVDKGIKGIEPAIQGKREIQIHSL